MILPLRQLRLRLDRLLLPAPEVSMLRERLVDRKAHAAACRADRWTTAGVVFSVTGASLTSTSTGWAKQAFDATTAAKQKSATNPTVRLGRA